MTIYKTERINKDSEQPEFTLQADAETFAAALIQLHLLAKELGLYKRDGVTNNSGIMIGGEIYKVVPIND